MLYGRDAERSAVAGLLDGARAGTSGVLLLRGEPGIGKTALLDYAVTEAGDMRVLRGAGFESEAELAFAGLHHLLRSAMDRIAALPGPQRSALEAAFGLGAASPADRLMVGLAVLSLLGELAEERPVLCVVDDLQWLDRASSEALALAGRRLLAEGVCLLLAARDGPFSAPGLPERHITGLPPEAAEALLDARGPLPADVRRRALAEAHGNPLALIELPDALARERQGEPSGTVPLSDRLQVAFHGQVSRLPAASQTMVLVAAAEETGELEVVLGAAAMLGAGVDALAPAEESGLVQVSGPALAFRHPLVRAAIYQRAPLSQRLDVHRALGDVLTGHDQSDRRAWHRAAAASGPDEEVAAELERAAVRARTRVGYAAAASAYERAAGLSPARDAQAHRLTLAAESAVKSGDVERATRLAERAARLTDDPRLLATQMYVRAVAHFWRGPLNTAHRLLLDGAELIDRSSPAPAVRMLMQALHTGWYLGEGPLRESFDRLAALEIEPGDPLAPLVAYALGVVRVVLDLPGPQPGPAAAAFAQARGDGADVPGDLVQVCGATLILGDDSATLDLTSELVAEARAAGCVGPLPTLLFFLAEAQMFHGRPRDALATASEGLRIAEDTGQLQWISQLSSFLAYAAAIEGDEERCRALAARALADAGPGAVAGEPWAHWALGVIDLGLGRAEQALSRLERLACGPQWYHVAAIRCVPDLVEAAVRIGAPERAARPFATFSRWAAVVRRPWADALVLRCRALLAPDADAVGIYTRALGLHDHGRPFEQAGTALLCGETMRRARRKAEARIHLSAGLETFARLGASPWASRARAELTATGAAAPALDAAGPLASLTPQELQIVRLAARGLSNRDIAAQLFLSPRTVGYHLYKAYPKLDVRSRKDLAAFVAGH